MKIKRYQTGGIAYTPFFRDSVTKQNSTSTAAPKEDKEEQLIQKEIINAIKENGLQNDVDMFLSTANSFLTKVKDANFFGTEGSASYDLSDLITIQSMANKVKRNNELHQEAENKISAEGAGSEVALTSDGHMYVYDDKGEVKTITASTYYNEPEKYKVLTNTELIQLREQHPGLTYNGSILSDLSNTIGNKSIIEYVKSTIGAFGTNKSSNQFDRYTVKQKDTIEEGFKQLLGISPGVSYKVTEADSIAHQGYSDKESLDIAVNYLYRTLPENMKHVLRAQTAAEGLDPDNVKDVKSILTMAVIEHTDHATDKKVELSSPTKSEKSGSGSGSSSTSKTEETFGNFVSKNGALPRATSIVLEGSNISFSIPSYHYDIIKTPEGKDLPSVTLGDETYQNLMNNGLVDTRSTSYLGELPITDIAYMGKDILVDNLKGGSVMFLPITSTGELDFSMMKQMDEIQKQIIKKRVTDPEEQAKIWEDNGFNYSEKLHIGVPKNEELRRYWTQAAYTSTQADSFKNSDLKNATMLAPVDDSITEKLSNLYNLGLSKDKKSGKVALEPGWFGNSYQGMIFIPLNDNQNQALISGNNAYIDKPDSDIVKAKQDAVMAGGGYDYQNGLYNRTLNGTQASDLD